jgi:AcrR family transcriptional regulator
MAPRPTPSTRPGPKPTLTHDAVVEAALDLIDADGLGALNLRKLAASLGVSAMTPYSYFEDKSALTGAMVSHGLDPDATAPWDVKLESAMRGMHDALERHPGVIELILAESDIGPLADFRQALIAMLVEAGFERRAAADALRTLTSYILGYTMLTRLRRRRRSRVQARQSFDHGLVRLMDSLRADAAHA